MVGVQTIGGSFVVPPEPERVGCVRDLAGCLAGRPAAFAGRSLAVPVLSRLFCGCRSTQQALRAKQGRITEFKPIDKIFQRGKKSLI